MINIQLLFDVKEFLNVFDCFKHKMVNRPYLKFKYHIFVFVT